MNSTVKVIIWASLLTLLTAGMGWLGVRDWDGESGGNLILALPGLPFLACVIALAGIGVHLAAAIALGCIAQFTCCLVLVVIARIILRALQGGGK